MELLGDSFSRFLGLKINHSSWFHECLPPFFTCVALICVRWIGVFHQYLWVQTLVFCSWWQRKEPIVLPLSIPAQDHIMLILSQKALVCPERLSDLIHLLEKPYDPNLKLCCVRLTPVIMGSTWRIWNTEVSRNLRTLNSSFSIPRMTPFIHSGYFREGGHVGSLSCYMCP